MICNLQLLYLFGISACFLAGTVEAIIEGFGFGFKKLIASYDVSVQIHGEGHVCGGGIIGVRYILTAAHCILNRTRHLRNNHISVLAGTSELPRTGQTAVTNPVEKVFFPREFHPTTAFSHGDIAVLTLSDYLYDVELDELRLPRNYQLDHKRAMISGFGWNEYRLIKNKVIGSTDGQLRYTIAHVLSDDKCEKSFPHGAIESDIHLCAAMQVLLTSDYGSQYGVCHGDSGGSLISEGYVIGVLSRITSDCDEREKPAVYTRVAHYGGMIHNVMERGCDPGMIELHTHFEHAKESVCHIL